jgi:hypothetical protein
MLKKILLILLVAFIAIQFFHPAKNKADGAQPNNIATAYTVPPDVKVILEKACNDCHTNNTRYPWYSRIQPVAWWLDDHIKEGKGKLNLDEYTHRSLRYQYHKLEEIAEQVKSGEMPLKSYTWVHKDAILTDAEKNTLIGWADATRSIMEQKYPIDSLIRKK